MGKERLKMTGVILFRAQPFHNGHLAQIKRAFEDMRKLDGELYVIVGSADKSGTKRNPIPIDARLDLINGTLEEEFSYKQRQYLHVVPLNDLSDEANNTPSWGSYLMNAMRRITDDTDFIFYYSDKPEIALSWFDDSARRHIWFKFLPRVNNINATLVRDCIIGTNQPDFISLSLWLPPYVYNQINKIREYIINAR
jgi:phosphopantetheine adenylyltransferase